MIHTTYVLGIILCIYSRNSLEIPPIELADILLDPIDGKLLSDIRGAFRAHSTLVVKKEWLNKTKR